MKRNIFIILLLLPLFVQAQEHFSFKMELVNPSQKVGEDSYFIITLKNISDTSIVAWHDPYPGSYGESSVYSYLIFDYKKKDGTTTTGFRRAFFDTSKHVFMIKPDQEYFKKIIAVRIPEAGPVLNIYAAPGIAKVRCRISAFRYTVVDTAKVYAMPYHNKEYVSDWIDVSQIDYSFYKFWKKPEAATEQKN